MDEVDAGQTGAPPVTPSMSGPVVGPGPGSVSEPMSPPGAGPKSAGDSLRLAREAQGLDLATVSARTRVPLRHLEAIEAADYQSLPSPTYAVGFARAYARAVGADEVATAQAVRVEVDRLGRRQPEYEPYEVADPARVPSRGLAIVAAGLALGLLVIAALWFGGSWLRRSAEAPVPVPVVATRAVPRPAAPRVTGGEVVLTAQDEVWMRVYDADDRTLFIGTMKPGERYVVPAGANDPRINLGRPDKLAVTLNGAAVPPLGTGERPIKDVRIGGIALAGRLSGVPTPVASAATPAPGAATPAAAASPSPGASVPPFFAAPTSAAEPRSTARRDRPPTARLTETQRANLESARAVRRTGASGTR